MNKGTRTFIFSLLVLGLGMVNMWYAKTQATDTFTTIVYGGVGIFFTIYAAIKIEKTIY